MDTLDLGAYATSWPCENILLRQTAKQGVPNSDESKHLFTDADQTNESIDVLNDKGASLELYMQVLSNLVDERRRRKPLK